jgi:hypothetical protein
MASIVMDIGIVTRQTFFLQVGNMRKIEDTLECRQASNSLLSNIEVLLNIRKTPATDALLLKPKVFDNYRGFFF